MDQFKLYLQYQKEVAAYKLKIIEQFQKGGRTKSNKRTSKIEITRNVLNDAGKPLHVTEIVQVAQKIYDVQLDRDSIVSAILKKIKADKTFIRTAPNTFALKTYTTRERRAS
ncbi:MAG: HTH domain-containing protein [Thermodesulfobacteriota bacterium]|nr:HTH domain-containing protein [Thermodesulfobacteriota bacterium]